MNFLYLKKKYPEKNLPSMLYKHVGCSGKLWNEMKYQNICEICGVRRYRDYEPATQVQIACHEKCLETSKEMVKNDRWKRLTVNDNWRIRMEKIDKVDDNLADEDGVEILSARSAISKVLEAAPFVTRTRLYQKVNDLLGEQYDWSNFKLRL